jgi:hypothetical protein
MIELVEGLPPGVVGLEAVGEVTADDYESVATPEVARARAVHNKITQLHILGERFTGFTAGGLWKDATLGVSHLASFERIAVVSDLESVRTLVETVGWSVPGEMRLFANAERPEAVAWVSGEPDAEGG